MYQIIHFGDFKMSQVRFQALLLRFRYGQMTAGSFCYIGPQGIVHGTTVSKATINPLTLFLTTTRTEVSSRPFVHEPARGESDKKVL